MPKHGPLQGEMKVKSKEWLWSTEWKTRKGIRK